MDPLPWLVALATGALHGAHPVNGWALASAFGRRAWPALACGHGAAIALVVAGVASGLSIDRRVALAVALVLLAALVVRARRVPSSARTRDGIAALASFAAANVQGAGLALVPALGAWCGSSRHDGPLLTATALVAVHVGAMLVTAAIVANGVGRVVRRWRVPSVAPAKAGTRDISDRA